MLLNTFVLEECSLGMVFKVDTIKQLRKGKNTSVYMPFNLMGAAYQIISKVLASRLKKVMGGVTVCY